MHTMKSNSKPKARRGSALLFVVIMLVALVGISGAMLAVSGSAKQELASSIESTRALYAAEAGVSHVLAQLTAHAAPGLGTANTPTKFGNGHYWGSAQLNPDGSWDVLSIGHCMGAKRAVQVTLNVSAGGIYQDAIFSGNSSGDPAYTLKFGGLGVQADAVTGNLYSGGNITFNGTSTDNGTPTAFGTVTTLPGSIIADGGLTPATPVEGQREPLPDIAGMNYATNNDIDVAAAFASAAFGSAPAGGDAWQLPPSEPAHIFRLNPSDRTSMWSATAKNDYFLEDPSAAMQTDASSDGTDCYKAALTDPAVYPGAVDGNHKVYFIDGNLWINNLSTMSFMLTTTESTGVQVTFVVKGNIYIGDNLYQQDKIKDGIALIAMKDSAVADSGNVYFGDPVYGTLQYMAAFMYAENDFFDNNLDAAGSAIVTLNGNMTAGNQVNINRDFGTQHSKLTVNYDNRIASGALTMPGLPKSSGTTKGWKVSIWREVAVP